MAYRNLLAIGLLNALLCAGFSGNALGGSFTNGDFVTYIQADWGDTADQNPAAVLLAAKYETVFASSSGLFEVGIPGAAGFSMVFSGAPELLNYLPDLASIGPLDADYVDPSSTPSGAFGGEVTALMLNIEFSDAGLLPGNLGIHFGDLVLQNFTKLKPDTKSLRSLNGLTVRQFAADGNILLGGGSFGIFTTADIPVFDAITANINSSYFGGTASAFATNNLTVPQP